MKLLAIGDFHGKFPKKLRNKIKSENPDLILSLGDFIPFSYSKICVIIHFGYICSGGAITNL